MSDEAWIEQSLARLEELETHKAQLEAYDGDPETLAEVEAEISALYETLDAVAGGGSGQETAGLSSDAAESATFESAVTGSASPTPSASSFEDDDEDDDAWASAAARQQDVASDDPFSASTPAASSDDPFASSGGSAFAADDSATFESSSFGPSDLDVDDTATSKSKLPWLAAAAGLVVAIGIGGVLMVKKDAAPTQAAPVASGEPKVITASAVPEDTQEPDAAKGAEVTRTPATVYKEPSSSAPATKRRAASSSEKKSSGKKQRRDRGSRDDGRRVSSADSNDPLAGL